MTILQIDQVPGGSADIAITQAATATLGGNHIISGTSADYTITISGLSPAIGDVLEFRVKDWAAASKQYTLDAGGTVKIAGRTRYLVLIHTNVVKLRWDGTDWQPVVLSLNTPWVSGGATDFTVYGSTTNPTRPASCESGLKHRRIGDSAEYCWIMSTDTGGTAGTGYYYITPLYSIDTAKVPVATGWTSYAAFGVFQLGIATTNYTGGVSIVNSTRVVFVKGPRGSTTDDMWQAGDWGGNPWSMHAIFTIPTLNW